MEFIHVSAEVKLRLAQYNVDPPQPFVADKKGKDNKQKGQEQQQGDRKVPVLVKPDDGLFGDLAIIQSRWKSDRQWTDIKALNASPGGSNVWIRGRIHRTRGKGKLVFLVLRYGFSSVQCVVDAAISSIELVAYAATLSKESIVDVYGKVVAPEKPVDSTSQKDVELHVTRIYCVSLSETILPFQLDDAARKEEKDDKKQKQQQNISVGQDIRLDNRWIDLRTPANHAIFRLQAAVGKYFREYFTALDFVEIHSPKIVPGVSEGGAEVFMFRYLHGKVACLAQSPQLYKQMAVVSDLFRVFEVGHVFRAEDSNTHRHMCEFVGLDFEMAFKEHYHEVLAVLANCFVYIFDKLNSQHAHEISVIAQQYPAEPLKYTKDTLVLEFDEAVQLLRDNKEVVKGVDFSTANEKALGKIVHEKYGTDLYIVDKYHLAARPFYTMPDPERPGYSNSYDVFLRGEEITSGAQRVHDPELLKERAIANNIPLSGIQKYIDSFKFGAFPHAGGGVGLERVVMLFLGLDNIRKTSLFPRDPYRLEP
jgi:aspartyl-tRNA synthetase